MSENNLPENRMILMESMDPMDSMLINVDEIMYAKRYDHRPLLYMDQGPHPYGRGLEITMRSGGTILIETKMSVQEFEIERAKYFTPVAPEKDKLEGADWGESDWEVDVVNTEWFWYHIGEETWVGASDMGDAISQAKVLGSMYKAVMYRKLSKEWDAHE